MAKKDMTVEIKNGNIIITAPVNKVLKPSSTGTTLSVASSHGNKETEVVVDGKNVYVGFNAYVYPNEKA